MITGRRRGANCRMAQGVIPSAARGSALRPPRKADPSVAPLPRDDIVPVWWLRLLSSFSDLGMRFIRLFAAVAVLFPTVAPAQSRPHVHIVATGGTIASTNY